MTELVGCKTVFNKSLMNNKIEFLKKNLKIQRRKKSRTLIDELNCVIVRLNFKT